MAFERSYLPGSGPLVIKKPRALPHWYRAGGLYFVTFRLAGSLPREAEEHISLRKQLWRQQAPLDPNEPHRWIFAYTESVLHNERSALLSDPAHAQVISDSLHYGDGHWHNLLAWCVMPNHVHVVFRLLVHRTLSETLRAWKSYTASRINQVRSIRGAIWQKDYFDHLIRDETELRRCIRYTLDNPQKAGLQKGPWRGLGQPGTMSRYGLGTGQHMLL
jgi:REP element-mobilizing transposase RayT